VRKKSTRARKTGPGFPLSVLKCHTHAEHFTVYPPGYAPYQRVPVLALSPDGAAILGEDQKAAKGPAVFEGSIFGAALDARRRRAWARSSEGGAPERWWSTQGRHLDLALRLTGISRSVSERTRELVAAVLGVALLFLREGAREELHGYHERGTAVSKILSKVRGGRQRALRLLVAGHLVGCWGRPRSSDRRGRTLEDLPFPVSGTPAPT
jgi:hypothetical protein